MDGDTLADIWTDDHLHRSEDAQYIATFLENRLNERRAADLPTHYVLNINSAWGTGKTFFLSRFAAQLKAAGHIVASVDAWSTDHAEDPLLAVMAAIEDAMAPMMTKAGQPKLTATMASLSRNAGSIAVAVAKGAVVQGLKKVLGNAVDEVSSIIDGGAKAENETQLAAVVEAAAGGGADAFATRIETLLNAEAAEQVNLFRKGQAAIDAFKRDLQKLTTLLHESGKTAPFYVLVDELDRCRPTYAISLLERAKHLFEVNDVVFIVATDTQQLASAIRAVYGQEFDSSRYLGRFFDRTYEFDAPNNLAFVEHMVSTLPVNGEVLSLPPGQSLADTLAHIFAAYAVPPRDMLRAFDLVRTVASTWTYKAPIEVTALLPLIIARQEGLSGSWDDPDTSERLSQGSSSPDPLVWNYHSRRQISDRAVFQVGSAFRVWQKNALKPLQESHRHETEDPIAGWIQRAFMDEFARAHGNSYSGGAAGPFSILRDYPSIIRKAGRFSQ